MKLLIFFCFLVSVNSISDLSEEYMTEKWNLFQDEFKPNYQSEIEQDFRYKIFKENLKYIEDHNKKYKEGLSTFELGINQFADKLNSEFIQEMYSDDSFVDFVSDEPDNQIESLHDINSPENFDWSDFGGVTQVKDQGKCAACYAFAVVGTIETLQWQRSRNLISLSEQNIIDCAKNYGCLGGSMRDAYRYVAKNGIDATTYYRYKIDPNNLKKCRFNPRKIGAKITGFKFVDKGNETAMKIIIANECPVAASMDTRHKSFRFYHRGFYYEEKCRVNKPNHAMVIVGYGKNGNFEYWKVKNSWGNKWGEKGYIRMARNRNNTCGIASNALYPYILRKHN